ncbi:MAG: Arc family DNA-binding protein [Planctomycetaceae bacterium]|nr:Arc family DNA-binding protein [Planctomycetaceae bacterium]
MRECDEGVIDSQQSLFFMQGNDHFPFGGFDGQVGFSQITGITFNDRFSVRWPQHLLDLLRVVAGRDNRSAS